jgi:hypothetical protein
VSRVTIAVMSATLGVAACNLVVAFDDAVVRPHTNASQSSSSTGMGAASSTTGAGGVIASGGAGGSGGISTECSGAPCNGLCQGGVCWMVLANQSPPAARTRIAVSSGYVVFGNADLWRVSISGGNVETLFPGANLVELAADATDVYWLSTSKNVRTIPLAGGMVRWTASAPNAKHMAIDDTAVYWDYYTNTTMQRAKKGDGGALSNLTDNCGYVNTMSSDGTRVAFINTGVYVYSCPLTGCGVCGTRLENNNPRPSDLIARTGTVYFNSTKFGGLYSVPIVGGANTTLTSTSPMAPGDMMALDGNDIYFTTNLNGVFKVAVTGGAAVSRAAGLDTIRALALDASSVYLWLGGSTNALVKAPRI